ncbi:methyltransferase type 11 [Methylomonas sp. LWB]|uniref:class I SAM-dependent DNA methyltransferase n=1 Tax=Methylomonas sp. LWB TaxID=1905845 RepID=UPI0008D99B38|nr:class I SAM-dependent methyltransferase [Methylomonas sp. LWB]OHX37131.1 methyltransferase type 11 [Methylomonas sp. LWB]
MSFVFDSYARYYDLLYIDKDYAAEAEYVVSHIHRYKPQAKTILELGCGTGAHAVHLARKGFNVVGVDISDSMLKRAEIRKAELPKEISSRLTFLQADVRTVRLEEYFDAVISLFHVINYQTTNTNLENTFTTAASHLKPGGVFLFDFWYGPAVLTLQPEVRVKRFDDETVKITRIAEPVMHINKNIVDVNYTIFIENKLSGAVEQLYETHKMRYLFLPELLTFHSSKFQELMSCSWMDDKELDSQTWSGIQILLAKHYE